MKAKKLLSALLAVAVVLSLTITAGAAEPAQDMAGSIVILHTNDVHGAIGGYAKVAALKDDYEAEGAYVLLMDAGDFIQGDPTVSAAEGAAAVELMNLSGYDAATLGNHEFDYGYDRLTALAQQAEFPLVAANVRYDGEEAFEGHVIFTSPDGTRIGVFGLTTPETATKAHPAKIQGVTFLTDQALFDCAQEQVDALGAAGCEYIICLGHLGIDAESAGNRSVDLLEEVDGIDFFIDGHSHSTLTDVSAVAPDGKVGDTYLTSAGTKLENVGVITITPEGISTVKNISVEDLTSSDKDVAGRADAIQKEIDDDYGAVFARTEVDLTGKADPGNRTEETNLGDLVCDALVWGAEEAGINVDAAVTNGGSIRAAVPAGDITKKDIHAVLPFGNTLSIVEVTGEELLEALEASTYCTPASIGAFPQVSGIVFTVDTTKTYDQGDRYPNSSYYAPRTIQRVSVETVGGKAFDEKSTYTIATNDFLAAGGDTYHAFAAASVNYDLGLSVDEVVMDYITEELGGIVTGADYGEPAGQITIIKELPFTDIDAGDPHYDAVKYCYENDIFQGTSDSTFEPYGTMTRGQMVTVLWRMNGSPAPEGTCPFSDVAENSPFRQAITWAAETGLTNGVSETRFNPEQAISCQQFLTILYRYAQFMEYDVSASITLEMYADADTISGYAQDAMEWAVGSGVLIADKVLRPAAAAIRIEVAQYLSNFCQKVVPAGIEAAA